jgi:MFS family permease
VKALGYSTAIFGALLFVNGAMVVLVELPLSGITQRLPAGRVIAAGSFLVGFGFLLNGVSESLPLLFGCVVVWTLGEVIGAPVGTAYVANLAPDHLRGRYQAANGMMWGLAAVAGPIAGTVLYSASPNALWIACGAMGLLAAALVTASVRGHRTDVPLD